MVHHQRRNIYKRYSLQAELVGVGEGRKLSCLSPIGENQDFDHRTDHHNHHSGLNYFVILGHVFVSFVGNLVMLVAKTIQEESSGQFGKKRSIIHQSSFSADKPIHCHNCPVLLTLFILVNHLKFFARVDISNRVVGCNILEMFPVANHQKIFFHQKDHDQQHNDVTIRAIIIMESS